MDHLQLRKQSAEMILRFAFAWAVAVAVAGQETSDNRFIGWYIQQDSSTHLETLTLMYHFANHDLKSSKAYSRCWMEHVGDRRGGLCALQQLCASYGVLFEHFTFRKWGHADMVSANSS